MWQKTLEGLNVLQPPFLEQVYLEGRAEALVEAMVLVLQIKFPGQAPVDMIQRIKQIQDRAVLQRWLDAALSANSFVELQQQTASLI
jgi:hypothetical protein